MPLPFQPKPLDADAAAYIARSGATDRAAINAFVRGVKALGLWSNMVCWPLRSSQNAGNGDTVYSLGGLGTFNGTLVNGPTWGADGVNFAAASHHILLSAITSDPSWKPFSTFAVTNMTFSDNFLAQAALCALAANTTNAALVSVAASTSNFLGEVGTNRLTGGSRSLSLGYTQGAFGFFQTGFSNYGAPATMNAFLQFNGTRTTTVSGTGTLPQTETGSVSYLFGGISTSGRNETAAFQAWFKAELSGGQCAALQTLYKQTLGTGLGLP